MAALRLLLAAACLAAAVSLARAHEDDCGGFERVCDAEKYLTTYGPVKGFHILCLKEVGDAIVGTIFLRGQDEQTPLTSTAKALGEFREDVERAVGMPADARDASRQHDSPGAERQPWRFFSTEGIPLATLEDVLGSSTVFVFEGGQWIWPGVRVGHKFVVGGIDDFEEGIEFETISMSPLVFAVRNFLSDAECDRLRAESEVHMRQSPVAHKDGDVGKPDTEWRTSTQHWLQSAGEPWLEAIDVRVGQLTRTPVAHQEAVQVLRYLQGQKYDAHHDFFDINSYRSNEGIQRMLKYGRRNRMITVFWYITDVSEGGSTWFPKANGLPQPGLPGGAQSFKSCEPDVGLHSYPERGKVIIFYSLLPNGDTDDASLHAGCPPKSDEAKWSANKWIWNM